MKRESFAFRALPTLIVATILAVPAQSSQAVLADEVFATVDGVEITRDAFERAVYAGARQTFYHGQPPGGEEFIEFRKSVADKMIVRELLLKEAERRGIEPDRASVDAQIAIYEERYSDTERWHAEGPQMIAALRTKFESDSVLEKLEAGVRTVPSADDAAVRQYYDENPALFTQPAQNRASIILLGVPAAATPAVWQAAREEADRILQRLQDGDSFAELASLHSSDMTASAGGDMGFLHKGTLSAAAEEAVNALAIDEVSEPVQVLEGIAIFKLTGRKPAELRDFEEVRQRAGDLLAREAGEQQWNALVADLRAASEVVVDTDYLTTLPEYVQ